MSRVPVKILGESKPVKQMVEMIRRVAASRTGVLVIGESGTGKELVARMIHEASPLKDKPFVPVNCGAIPENLIESEMFGHKRGSFTGAVSDKAGLFEVANGGTLFLDEIGELPLSMQVKLLRAIQERAFRKVGGTEDVKVELRIIAATNRDLEAGVAAGTFREDLYYRLNVILIKTPPLRERKGDVRILAEHFLRKTVAKQGKALEAFTPEALSALENYAWPGNVRELENVLERAITLETGPLVSLSVFPDTIKKSVIAAGLAADQAIARAAATLASAGGPSTPGTAGAGEELRLPAADFSRGALDLDAILGQVEQTYLNAAIHHAGGSKKKAAELLGITFRSLRYRLQKLGVAGSADGEEDGDGETE